jgi:hypothetical protein
MMNNSPPEAQIRRTCLHLCEAMLGWRIAPSPAPTWCSSTQRRAARPSSMAWNGRSCSPTSSRISTTDSTTCTRMFRCNSIARRRFPDPTWRLLFTREWTRSHSARWRRARRREVDLCRGWHLADQCRPHKFHPKSGRDFLAAISDPLLPRLRGDSRQFRRTCS